MYSLITVRRDRNMSGILVKMVSIYVTNEVHARWWTAFLRKTYTRNTFICTCFSIILCIFWLKLLPSWSLWADILNNNCVHTISLWADILNNNCVHAVITEGGEVYRISQFRLAWNRVNVVVYVRRKCGVTCDPNLCGYALLMFLGRKQ
jgi:hypothetical protein